MHDFKLNDKFEQYFRVTDAVYNGFVHIFNDTNPLHTNENFARRHGFKGKVMHGNILNGFVSFFVGESLPLKNVIIHSQEVQFKNAVYLYDELRFEARITGIYDSVNAVEFKFSFTNSSLQVVAKGKIQIGILI